MTVANNQNGQVRLLDTVLEETGLTGIYRVSLHVFERHSPINGCEKRAL